MILNDLEQDFVFGTCVGYGQSSVVYTAVCHDDDETYAIKTIQKELLYQQNLKNSIIREIEIMREIKHKSAVTLHRVYEDGSAIHLVMTYAPGSTLYRRVIKCDKYSESKVHAVLV